MRSGSSTTQQPHMLHFFNSLTRRREEFVPLEPGRVGMYVCGPTIYAPPHIGNLRTFFFADILHRYLEFRGYEVRFVMNLTDVDDKTIAGAVRAGVSLREHTEPFGSGGSAKSNGLCHGAVLLREEAGYGLPDRIVAEAVA